MACTPKDAPPPKAATTQLAATTKPVGPLLADELPSPQSFKATDMPGDDGSAILVQWAKPNNEPKGVKYVVEIAKSAEDFKADKFGTTIVAPSPASLAGAKPYLFETGKAKNTYFTEITPTDSEQFAPPKKPDKPTPEQVKQQLNDFANQKAGPIWPTPVLNSKELARAMAALEAQTTVEKAQAALTEAQAAVDKAQAAPTDASALASANAALADASSRVKIADDQRKDAKWFEELQAHLKELDQKAQEDQQRKINGQTWQFRLAVIEPDVLVRKVWHIHAPLLHDLNIPYWLSRKTYVASSPEKPVVVSASAKPHVFKWEKVNNLAFSVLFMAIVATFIEIAKRRPNLFIRKIAGLEAVDEAIGRSTEMDRPVFFVHGLGGMGDLSTMAAVNVLSRVAGRAAQHDTRVRVMNIDPIVTAVSQEVVQQAYTQAGRPDAYNPDDVSLVASDQFSYVAAVSGNMVREQPGAIFLMGSFAAESLLLAETGASTGAIQVAGTDAYTQLPFFITTCDYTLIGEELYAASAYLSREPRLLGSLRGQDVGKAFLMITMVGASIALTAAAIFGADLSWLRNLFAAN